MSPVSAPQADAASLVIERVRDWLRAEQTDPSRQPEQASMTARAEVRRHNDFALARGLAVLEDEPRMVRDVLAAVAGYRAL